jgi:hypothetical protein
MVGGGEQPTSKKLKPPPVERLPSLDTGEVVPQRQTATVRNRTEKSGGGYCYCPTKTGITSTLGARRAAA